MLKLFRKHKVATAALLLLLLPLLYLSFVAVKTYVDTPQIIAETSASGKLTLKLEDFSDQYLKTLLTVEDPNFYSHNGVDLTTPGAGYTTITQGLVKGYFFKDGFTPGFLRHRKLKQTLIAWVFNRQVDKSTQLRFFVNTVYLGQNNGKEISGFQDGARAYFNKEFSALTFDEYLSLVAMIIGPNEFSVAAQPMKNSERVKRIKRLLEGTCKPANLGDVYYQDCSETMA
jgi:membrane peptidoglycan carboxypeptidase